MPGSRLFSTAGHLDAGCRCTASVGVEGFRGAWESGLMSWFKI